MALIYLETTSYLPRIKWEALEGTVEVIKDAAEKYENAFNDIISTVTDTENFKAVSYRQNHDVTD